MNKNILYITCILFAFISCVKEEDEIFSNSADIRAEKLNDKCQEALTNATKGWIMQYFPNTELYGGYNLYMNFTEEDVEMRHESDFSKSEISKYSMRSDNSSVLSFDTYNSILHQYSDPGKDGVGYGGDFEFVIKNVTDDYIILKGVKGGDFIFMNRIPDEMTREEYFDKLKELNTIIPRITSEIYWYLISDQDTLFLRINKNERNFLASGSNDFSNSESVSIVPTVNGVQFNPPLFLNNKSFDSFTLENKSKLISDNKEISAEIIGESMGDFFSKTINKGIISLIQEKIDTSDKFKTTYDKILASVQSKNRTLTQLTLQSNSTYGNILFIETVTNTNRKTQGFLLFENNQISKSEIALNFKGFENGYDEKIPDLKNGKNYYDSFDGIAELTKILSSKFTLSTSNPLNPGTIRFTDANDNSIWFEASVN